METVFQKRSVQFHEKIFTNLFIAMDKEVVRSGGLLRNNTRFFIPGSCKRQ
jgi:hypothetical protein